MLNIMNINRKEYEVTTDIFENTDAKYIECFCKNPLLKLIETMMESAEGTTKQKFPMDYKIKIPLFIEAVKNKNKKIGVKVEKIWQKWKAKNIFNHTQENEKLKEEVIYYMLAKDTNKSTELMVESVKAKHKIYTTSNDERSEIWYYLDGVYVPNGRSMIKAFCRSIVGDIYTSQMVNRVIEKIIADTQIKEDDFFRNVLIDEIIVQNGILNIHTQEITPITPNKIFFNKMNMVYNPKADCPAFKKHLKTVLKHESDSKVVQEIFGWSLYKKYNIEKAIMLIGTGRNGKGKTLTVLERFAGYDNCSHLSLQKLDEDPYSVGELHQKSINIGGDIERTALKKTAIFKGLTGGDRQSAQRKFLSNLNFINYAKMLFATNELPITYDTSIAFFSRWILIEFPNTFVSEKDYEELSEKEKKNIKVADIDLISKLTTEKEMEGILIWALDGLKRLLKNKSFSNSKNTEEIKKLWIRKSDSFAGFCEDYLEVSFRYCASSSVIFPSLTSLSSSSWIFLSLYFFS